jgi:hypothetical protein
VIDALTRFLAPSFADTSAAIFVLPEIVCEVSLLAYLLIKGVRTPESKALEPPHPEAARVAGATSEEQS